MAIIPFLSKSSFDPEVTDILAAAFDVAWERVRSSGSPMAATDTADATRELLAKNIIALAQTGERDKNRLVEGALANLASEARGRQTSPKRD